MIILENIEQGSEEWDSIRSQRPTASEFGKIYTGGGKVSTQREAYMRRLSVAAKYPVPQFTGNAWTERGNALEPEARERFIKETGFDVREVGFVEKEGSIAGCSPDGIIYNSAGEPVAGVEIKCFKMDKHLTILNKGVLPTENKPQVHGGLDVSKLDAWLFVLYCPDAFPLDFRIIEVTPDSYTMDLGGAINEFVDEYRVKWQQYLAEYEVDMLGKKTAEMAPVVSNIINREESII